MDTLVGEPPEVNGAPLAPYGLKADGSPRIKPAGPGRPKGDDKPHVTASEPSPPAATGGGVDYTADLMNAGDQVWLILSVNKGIAFFPRKRKDGTVRPLVSLPDTRAHAALFHEQLPGMARAWNEGARQNATVRRYVGKLGGEDGGISWMLAVGVTSAMFAMAAASLARPEMAEQRAELAAANNEDLEVYVKGIVEKIGLEAAA